MSISTLTLESIGPLDKNLINKINEIEFQSFYEKAKN